MSREAVGIVLALLASLSFESGYLLMTQESRRVSRSARPGGRFLRALIERPRWLLAIGLDGAGILLELFALREASLIVVQPLMSVGLIGLVIAARFVLKERIDARTVLGAAAVAAGVVLVIVAAPPDARDVRLSHTVPSVAVLAVLAAIVVSAYVRPTVRRGWWLVACAAAADTLVAISGNQIARAWIEHPLIAVLWACVVGAAGAGSVTAESAALQRLPASRVGPIVSATGAVAPVVLLALLAPHRFELDAHQAILLGIGLVLTGAGASELSVTAQEAVPDGDGVVAGQPGSSAVPGQSGESSDSAAELMQ